MARMRLIPGGLSLIPVPISVPLFTKVGFHSQTSAQLGVLHTDTSVTGVRGTNSNVRRK